MKDVCTSVLHGGPGAEDRSPLCFPARCCIATVHHATLWRFLPFPTHTAFKLFIFSQFGVKVLHIQCPNARTGQGSTVLFQQASMVSLSLLRFGKSALPAAKRLQGSLAKSREKWLASSSNQWQCSWQKSPLRHFSSGDSQSTTSFYSPEEILDQCSDLYDSLTTINERLGGVAIPKSSHIHTSMPFCLLVGNHSSGKSSFINYVLQRNIQKAGVAPTDDTFTVIAPGAEDSDADGPTLIGDPDLGFASLRQFGPTLIHHTQLKYRTSRLNFMLVSGGIDKEQKKYTPWFPHHNPIFSLHQHACV
jgi:Dynamin family